MKPPRHLLAIAAAALLLPLSASALPSSLDATSHHAWSQNAGWLNLLPGKPAGDGVQVTRMTVSGTAWGQSVGWVDFGDGSPANGLRYSNASTSDCGVNMDWRGNLSGYAWSQNAGWISFGWASAAEAHRPRLNLSTFLFDGYAWSQNLGWIYLGGGWLKNGSSPPPATDSDADGIPDSYELASNGNLTTWNATSDSDGDALPDGWEFAHFLSLSVSDGTQDSDGDGWSDAVEYTAGTDPGNANLPGPYPEPSPGSNIESANKYAWAQNLGWINGRHNQPSDPAGIVATHYYLYGNAWAQNAAWISLGDGTPQNGVRYSQETTQDCGVNVDWRLNLSGYGWSQNMGWINFGWAGPNDPDRPRVVPSGFAGYAWSQNAGWIDLSTVHLTGLMTVPDTDGDGLPDQWEFQLTASLSVLNATADTDGDGLSDAWEFAYFHSVETSLGFEDSDGDGWRDAVEFAAGTDPTNPNDPAPYPSPSPGSTIDGTNKYAWAQNLGWMNARHNVPSNPDGITVTAYVLYGKAWLQNAGWIDFGDGTPRNGLRYGNGFSDAFGQGPPDPTDFGVNIDCDLNLSGYAWAQNVGWIYFGWAEDLTNPDRARIIHTPTERRFAGYAWAQNAGWINLNTLNNTAINEVPDTDHDGLPDAWEYRQNIILATYNATTDLDSDGVPDGWEFTHFRSLFISNGEWSDFDQDGFSDLEEYLAGSNPRDVLSLPPPSGSTFADGGKYAWAQNVGWINFKHNRPSAPSGVIVREYFLSGRAWGQNIGWMDLGDGTPVNGIRYGNAMSSDTGVNHDGAGNLSGWAWSQNGGWINFGWGLPAQPTRARIDLSTGALTGYAWSQNMGWINLGSGLQTETIALADTDSDGLDDGWEREHFGSLITATATSDTDLDGQRDVQEFNAGTDPANAASTLRITSHSINAARTLETLTFTSSPTRLYRVNSSPDLTTWTPSTTGWTAGNAGTATTIPEALASPQTRYFFTVSAKRPLTP